jgi:hypothetical protein
MKKEKAVERKSRQPGSVVVAGWCAIVAVPLILGRMSVLIISGQLEAIAVEAPDELPIMLTPEGIDEMAFLLVAPIAVLSLFSGIGILKRKRWAWVALVLFLVLGLMVNLVRAYFSQPEYVLMLIYAGLVLLLNQPDVRSAFRIGRPSHDPVE